MSEAYTYIGSWHEFVCPCGASNFVYDDFADDVTSGEDIESIRCWDCQKTNYVTQADQIVREATGVKSPEDCWGLHHGMNAKELIEKLGAIANGVKAHD